MRDKSVRYMFTGTFPQLIAVLAGTISAIADGMQYGWSAPIIPLLKSPGSPVLLNDFDDVLIEIIYMLGGVCGLPITVYLVDKIGRKKSVLVAACANLTGWILIAVANKIVIIFVARFMIGIAGDMAFVAAPMYVGEIADQKIRGFLSAVIYLMLLAGILLIYAIGPFIQIYASSLVGASFFLIQLATFTFMPESPYYLLSKGKHEQAKKSLNWLRQNGKIDDVDKELEEISAAVERQKSEKGRPQDLILVKSNRKALTIMSVINAAQHFSSISVILMNLHTILEAAGSIYIKTSTAAIIFSVVMLIAASIASLFIDRFGRKKLLITSSLLTGLCLLILAIYFNLKTDGYDVKSASWVPIVCVMFYAAVFKIGLGVVPIVLTAELFPAKVKAMGMTISDAMYVFWALVSVYLYQYLVGQYGIHVPFYIFACSTLLTAFFCWWYVPETKGKTLEQIQLMLKGISEEDVVRTEVEIKGKCHINEKDIVTHI